MTHVLLTWQQLDPVLVLAHHGISNVYLVSLVLVECHWLNIPEPESQLDQVVLWSNYSKTIQIHPKSPSKSSKRPLCASLQHLFHLFSAHFGSANRGVWRQPAGHGGAGACGVCGGLIFDPLQGIQGIQAASLERNRCGRTPGRQWTRSSTKQVGNGGDMSTGGDYVGRKS